MKYIAEGYYIDSTAIYNNIPEFLEDTVGVFTFLINREYSNKKQRRVLETVESLFPPADSILKSDKLDESKLQINESLWWSDHHGRVRIPYSITWSAVKYYWDLIELHDSGSFDQAYAFHFRKALFKYEAIIKYYESFETIKKKYNRVYVVTQRLGLNVNCGPYCRWGFSARRLVVIDGENEEVIAVFDDGFVIYYQS